MGALPVSVRALTRRFGRRTALADVDLEVAPGEIVGLAGPNGSGKTTLLKVLAGFLRPGEGQARLFDLDPWRDAPRIMRSARFVFAPPALFGSLTAAEHLRHLPRLGGARPTGRDVEATLARVGLEGRGGDRVRTFSFGMRQRLALAQALLPRPELLVLDEPTDGLDPLAVLELRRILSRLREEEGVAILLSSHLLLEIEELVDRLLVLRDGRPLFHGTPAEMVGPARELRLGVDDPVRAREVLAAHGHAAELRDGGLALAAGGLDLEAARGLLGGAGLVLTSFSEHVPTLEEALLARLRAERGGEGR